VHCTCVYLGFCDYGHASMCVIPGLTAVFVVGLGRSVDDSDDDEPEISSEDEQQHNNSDVELSD